MMNDPSTASSRIFVGNIPRSEMTKYDLQDRFKKYGAILGIALNRGFGFIQYEDESSAIEAIKQENGAVFQGKNMEVNQARVVGGGRRSGDGPGLSRSGDSLDKGDTFHGRSPLDDRSQDRDRSQDGDSPVERNPQSNGQEGVEANVPQVAFTINRLHLEQKKLSGAARRKKKKTAGLANTDTGSKKRPEQTASSSEGVTGAGSGTYKRTNNSCGTPTSAEKQPSIKRHRTLPEVSSKDAASNFKMAIVGEKYPEDKLVEEDINDIQSEILRMVDGTKPGEPLPLLRNYFLQEGALIYFCDNQESCNWLSTHINGTKLRDKFFLKVVEKTCIPKPIKIKVAFKTKDINTKNPEVLFRRLELLNPGLKTTYWKFVDRQEDSKGQRLILLIDQESAKILKSMNLAAYTGVDKGLFKILYDPSGGEAGTTLSADQNEGAMEPMDFQAPEPGQSTVDDGAWVSWHT